MDFLSIFPEIYWKVKSNNRSTEICLYSGLAVWGVRINSIYSTTNEIWPTKYASKILLCLLASFINGQWATSISNETFNVYGLFLSFL